MPHPPPVAATDCDDVRSIHQASPEGAAATEPRWLLSLEPGAPSWAPALLAWCKSIVAKRAEASALRGQLQRARAKQGAAAVRSSGTQPATDGTEMRQHGAGSGCTVARSSYRVPRCAGQRRARRRSSPPSTKATPLFCGSCAAAGHILLGVPTRQRRHGCCRSLGRPAQCDAALGPPSATSVGRMMPAATVASAEVDLEAAEDGAALGRSPPSAGSRRLKGGKAHAPDGTAARGPPTPQSPCARCRSGGCEASARRAEVSTGQHRA